MATGFESHLNVLHLGKQTDFNTPATPNIYLVGVTNHTARPEVTYHMPEGEKGLSAPSDLIQVTKRAVTLSIDVEPVYEQLHYLLEMIFGEVTPSGTGPFTRTYTAPVYSTVSPAFYTIGRGQSQLYYTYDSCAISSATFKYDSDSGFAATLDILAKNENVGTYTIITRPYGLTPIPVKSATLYVDNPASAFGTTQLAGVLRSAEITVNPGLHYKYLPGDINAQGYGQGKWQVSIKVTFEMKSTIKALYDEVLTTPPDVPFKNVRVAFDKDANNMLHFDLASVMKVDGDVWTDADGNVTLDMVFDGAFDDAAWFTVELTNNVA